MRICFIRHAIDKVGKDIDFKGEQPLTLKGKRILRQVIPYYDSENISMVYSSPTKRALQSAKIIAKRYNVPIVILDDLRERTKFDYVKGSQDEKDFWDNYLNYNYTNTKFETCRDYVDRNFKAFDTIIKKHDQLNQNVVVVGHSATLYALNAYFNGIPQNKQIVWMQCGNCCMVKYETKNTKQY